MHTSQHKDIQVPVHININVCVHALIIIILLYIFNTVEIGRANSAWCAHSGVQTCIQASRQWVQHPNNDDATLCIQQRATLLTKTEHGNCKHLVQEGFTGRLIYLLTIERLTSIVNGLTQDVEATKI